MNEYEQRKQIRDRIARSPLTPSAEVQGYMTCPECGSGLEWQYIGGQGDWRQRIVCEYCFHIRKNVPHERVIIPLVAIQYGLTLPEARQREEQAEQEWHATVARAAV